MYHLISVLLPVPADIRSVVADCPLWQHRGNGPVGSFMYVLLILETLLRAGHMKPVHFAHTPGAIGNYVILPLAAQMLVLSLRD